MKTGGSYSSLDGRHKKKTIIVFTLNVKNSYIFGLVNFAILFIFEYPYCLRGKNSTIG